MDNEGDLREQDFHNATREYIVSLLFFVTLYIGSYYAIRSFKKQADREELYSGDDEDATVYRLSVWCCSFTLATSMAAVLLLPFSVLSNEVLIAYPNSYYVQWLNTSLVHGLWNSVFFFSNLALFIVMPFTHFLSESSGFTGSRRGLRARMKETAVTLILLAVLVVSLFCVASAFLGIIGPQNNSGSSHRLLDVFFIGTWLSCVPYVDSWITLIGVLLLLLCTPLGFARLFSMVNKVIVKPHFLRNLNEEMYSVAFVEDSLRRKMTEQSLTFTLAPVVNGVRRRGYQTTSAQSHRQNISDLLHETELARRDLETKMKVSSVLRNIGYPLAMMALSILTVISVLMVSYHTLELFFGRSSLPGVDHAITLGTVSFSAFGLAGVVCQVIVIFYILFASLAGLYGLPIFMGLEPRLRDTAMTKITANCALWVVLSTALPVLCRLLGITRFDLLGEFSRLDWLSNFYLVLFYNLLFVTATVICLFNKLKLSLYVAMCRKLGASLLRSRANSSHSLPQLFSPARANGISTSSSQHLKRA